MSRHLFLNLVLTTTLVGLMQTMTAAHPLAAPTSSNATATVAPSYPHLELLRGRDGTPGRDGMPGRDGREGRDGAKGEKGEIGSRGEKGERGEGLLGPRGIPGAPGPQGPAGLPGPQRAVGEKGDHGLPGLQGPQGMQGPVGPKGTQGSVGPKGTQGSVGPKGTQGSVGPKGAQGPVGPTGTPGSVGPKGAQGPVGPKGAQGPMGPNGGQGPVGPKGAQGPTGQKGTRGATGLKGAQGPWGQKGERGTQGLTGQKGSFGQKGEKGTPGGAIYTRWGKSSCPSVQGTELVYSGKAGGSHQGRSGGAANYLCMPNDPQYKSYSSQADSDINYIYGAEYTIRTGQPMRSVNDHDAPCAICFASTRGSVLMIPAKTSCPAGWTEEYDGYLMSEKQSNEGRTMYICVDESPESVPGQNGGDGDRVELFMVEARCEGLTCPPYYRGRELTCVVCTR